MTLIFTFGLIILFILYFSLQSRITKLEEQLRKFSSTVPSNSITPNSPSSQPSVAITAAAPATAALTPVPTLRSIPHPTAFEQQVGATAYTQQFTPALSSAPQSEFFLYRWFKDNSLIKVGAIIFFLGAAWFVSYAIDQNWLSPLTQIILGLLLAALIAGVGILRSVVAPAQYQVLTVLGVAIGFGTIVASQFAFSSPVIPAALAGLLLVLKVTYGLFVAIKTQTQWMAVTAAVAGLVVPLLTNPTDPSAFSLLSYLFFLSAGLLGVVFFTTWRNITLLLLIGTTLYVSAVASTDALADGMVWLFVILFTALFYGSTTVSMLRSNRPVAIDVTILGLTGLQFVIFAVTLAMSPNITLFLAAMITAGVGYFARQRGAHVDIVSLSALVSLVLSLVATVQLFDGYVLTIVLALEAALVTVGSLFVATVKRSVYVAAATFVLPLFTGLVDMQAGVWSDGILHAHTLGLIVVYVSITGVALWMIEQPALKPLDWVRHVAGILLGSGFWFGVLAVSTIIGAAATTTDSVPWRMILYSGLALLTIGYVALRVPESHWRRVVMFTLLPVALLLPEFLSASIWNTGIGHAYFIAALFVLGVLTSIVLLYVWLSRRFRLDDNDAVNAFSLLWVALGYGFLLIGTLSGALLDGVSETVVRYVGHAVLVYGVYNVMLYLRVRFVWTVWIVGLFTIPLLQALMLFSWSGWATVFAIEAVGLYVLTTIVYMVASTLMTYRAAAGEVELVQQVCRTGFAVAGGLTFCVIWMVAHTVATGALAVMMALFVYTIIGLALYSYGRVAGNDALKRAGMLLLGVVVLRLGLIDVWGMEPLWRFVTFMGIGALFIITALFERDKSQTEVAE